MKRTTLTLCIATIFTLSACGEPAGDINAINLKSGETQTFASEGELPDGWAVCPTPECDVLPPSVPCQNLSGDVCELNPSCRVKVVSCQGGGTVVPPPPPVDTDPSYPEPAPIDAGVPAPEPTDPPEPAPLPTPGPTQTCEVVCLPKNVLLCEELTDPTQCQMNPECSWEELCPLGACTPEGDCPPCVGQCFPKQPQGCDALDENSCQARPDCSWMPQPCPMCDAPAPGDDPSMPGDYDPSPPFPCECPSFCQPSDQVCPAIVHPAPDFCGPDGLPVPKFDENGCVVAYLCEPVCAPVAMPMIECADGTTLEMIYDSYGCLVDWECRPIENACDQLAQQYQETLREAKKCDDIRNPSISDCSTLVSNALFCPCATYVNSANTAAIAKLKTLATEAQTLECYHDYSGCPPMPCVVPQGGNCAMGTTDSSGSEPFGSCEDF
ncbi:MAG: hypothetical protein JRH20_19945 [Deltaproteobacteria bacterium]|nr:hypothetical protein [Deltaproteobacteria bacterium]